MAEENTSLSPRETMLHMLEHMPDDVSYEDIVRQLRILRQIEWVMKDVEMAGHADGAVPKEKARKTGDEPTPTQIPYSAGKSSLVLRSRPLFNWRSLAERSEERTDSFFVKASWIY